MILRNDTRILIFLTCLFISANSNAQIKSDNGLTISGYVDTYYSYDFNDPESHYRPAFIYNYNRTNEVNVNLAMIKLSISHSNTKTIRDYTMCNVVRSIETKGSELKNSNFALASSLSLTF